MTAAVLHSPGDIRIENVARPQLSSSRDVLIGVEAAECVADIGRMMVKERTPCRWYAGMSSPAS